MISHSAKKTHFVSGPLSFHVDRTNLSKATCTLLNEFDNIKQFIFCILAEESSSPNYCMTRKISSRTKRKNVQ